MLKYIMEFFEKLLLSINVLNLGPATTQALKRHNIKTIWDLLTFYPKKAYKLPLTPLERAGNIAAVPGKIIKLSKVNMKKIKYILDFQDEQGQHAKLLFSTPIALKFKPGDKVIVYGKYDRKTFVHPKILIQWNEEQFHYNMPMPLTDYSIKTAVKKALQYLPEASTYTLKQHIKTNTWQQFFQNLHGIHGLNAFKHARVALLQLEAIAWHISARQIQTNNTKHAIYDQISAQYQQKYNHLNETLTSCQQQALADIKQDLSNPEQKHRMIFGDVCTGKTRVSMLTALHVISKGHQVWFIAPTTMLAQQHYDSFVKTFQSNHITEQASGTIQEHHITEQASNTIQEHHITEQASGILQEQKFDTILQNTNQIDLYNQTKSQSLKIQLWNKQQKLSSDTNVVIGTHALLHIPTPDHTIGLIIIDEQHKFGVLQRHTLLNKDSNNQSYVLSLSATPIPRSLAMVTQKYINVSLMTTRTNPVQIQTLSMITDKIPELMHKLERQEGLTYWVCPMIEENEMNLTSVKQRFQALNDLYPGKIGLLHGSMKKSEQAEVYQQALSGQISVLVSTTVIEVGIDIPQANLIIIEHCERFGLAQLHQLRGRVGRHGSQGICILLHPKKISNVSQQRIQAMKNISNGFELAERDLQIRGQGTTLGTEQTGFREFMHLDPIQNSDILSQMYALSQELELDKYSAFAKCFFNADIVET